MTLWIIDLSSSICLTIPVCCHRRRHTCSAASTSCNNGGAVPWGRHALRVQRQRGSNLGKRASDEINMPIRKISNHKSCEMSLVEGEIWTEKDILKLINHRSRVRGEVWTGKQSIHFEDPVHTGKQLYNSWFQKTLFSNTLAPRNDLASKRQGGLRGKRSFYFPLVPLDITALPQTVRDEINLRRDTSGLHW